MSKYTCEACTAVTTRITKQSTFIYRRVSASILGDCCLGAVHVTWDNTLTILENHERAAQEFIDRHFPQCRLRKMVYIQGEAYVFGIYYSNEQDVPAEEANGHSLLINVDRTALRYEGDEFELN